MIIGKSKRELEKMRAAGRLVGQVREHLRALVKPGITTMELDRAAEKMIRDAGALPLDDRNASIDPMGPVVWRGILLNVLNPKLTVFFFAFLPHFLDASPGLLDPKLIGLGGIFMLMTLVVFAVYALASAAIRDLVLAAPVARRWIERALGAFLIGFAARLALTDR